MATCEACAQDMGRASTCLTDPIDFPDGKQLAPVPYLPDYGGEAQRCHDCNIRPGGYHHPGCDMETCPRCQGQMIGCGCLSDDAYTAWVKARDLADEHLRLAERLGWHLADCHAVLRSLGVTTLPTSYGHDGTEALSELHALIDGELKAPRDYTPTTI